MARRQKLFYPTKKILHFFSLSIHSLSFYHFSVILTYCTCYILLDFYYAVQQHIVLNAIKMGRLLLALVAVICPFIFYSLILALSPAAFAAWLNYYKSYEHIFDHTLPDQIVTAKEIFGVHSFESIDVLRFLFLF